MCSRDEQRAVPRGERPVVRIRRRTKRGVCARVSSFPELEAAGCRVMRSLYPCGAGCAQRSPDNHRTAATVIASAERIPYVAEDDSNFLSGGLSTLPPSCRHALVDEAPHVLRAKSPRVRQAAVAVGRIFFLVCLQGRIGRAVSQSRRGPSVPPDRGQVTRTCPWRPVCSRGICCSSSHCLSCFPGWPKRLKAPQEATTSRGRTAVRNSGKKELSEPWCGASRTSACTS